MNNPLQDFSLLLISSLNVAVRDTWVIMDMSLNEFQTHPHGLNNLSHTPWNKNEAAQPLTPALTSHFLPRARLAFLQLSHNQCLAQLHNQSLAVKRNELKVSKLRIPLASYDSTTRNSTTSTQSMSYCLSYTTSLSRSQQKNQRHKVPRSFFWFLLTIRLTVLPSHLQSMSYASRNLSHSELESTLINVNTLMHH